MNMIDFINSKDVRQHLKDIGYRMSSLEATYAVYRCDRLSVAEKHKAYGIIMDTMDDCTVKDKYSGEEFGLFEVLDTVIRTEKVYIDSIRDNTDSVYVLAVRYARCESWDDDYDRVYKSYESCLEAAKEIHGESIGGKVRFMINKLGIEKPELSFSAWLNDELEIRMIYPYAGVHISERESAMFDIPGRIEPNIPHPFREGDLLGMYDRNFYNYDGTPFEYHGMSFDRAAASCEEIPKEIGYAHLERIGNGYVPYRYTDLEYCERLDKPWRSF